MKIKAYNKYDKQWVIIDFGQDDEVWDEKYSSNSGVSYKVSILVSAEKGDKDDCSLKRWSDLEKLEIIK